MKTFLVSVLATIAFFSPQAHAASPLLINGAGATFPYPIYAKWFHEYGKANPHVRFNYQSIGSGGGIRQITEKTVDFGASDAPLTNEELSKLSSPLLHIPTVIGAVVITYNVPGISHGLKLDGTLIVDIYQGTVTQWNDPRIAALNPKLSLPSLPIIVMHRSDGSGTTFVFTEYLAKVNSSWKKNVGMGKSVSWPVGLGAKGNEGVTGLVKQTPGAIGYVELGYAKQNNLAVALVKNKSGTFVEPTINTISAAAARVSLPADFRVSLTDASGTSAYPISAFTYLLVYKNQTDALKGTELKKFLSWAISDGQKLAPALHYAPLPTTVTEKVRRTLAQIQVTP